MVTFPVSNSVGEVPSITFLPLRRSVTDIIPPSHILISTSDVFTKAAPSDMNASTVPGSVLGSSTRILAGGIACGSRTIPPALSWKIRKISSE